MQQPQLVRRAGRLLDTIAAADGGAEAPGVGPARAVCALLLGDRAAAEAAAVEAGSGQGADSWAAAWLAAKVLAQWPECARAAADGGTEGGEPAAIDLQRDWHGLPHVKAIITVRPCRCRHAAMRGLLDCPWPRPAALPGT
jgi:hypothetical protein